MNDTKLTIANALLNLLKTQPLNKITTTIKQDYSHTDHKRSESDKTDFLSEF